MFENPMSTDTYKNLTHKTAVISQQTKQVWTQDDPWPG